MYKKALLSKTNILLFFFHSLRFPGVSEVIDLFYFHPQVMFNSAIKHSLLRQARRNAQHVARRAASTAVPTAPGKPWPMVVGAAVASGATSYWYANTNASALATPMPPAQPTTIANKVDAKTIQTAFTRLQQVLPAEHVTVDEETLQFHGFTTNSYHNEGAPNIVVYPQSTDDVVKIINIANELK